MKQEPAIFLQHILESIELIEKRMQNVNHGKFIGNIDLQDMIIRRLEIIGEAVRNLPGDFRKKHSAIDWQNPADMRSSLIHGYFEVDSDIVWDTVTKDLPPFKQKIKKLLEEIEG
ncbi:hypothetical protein A2867_02770 [Candidatus Daviesbacteria bacterium RIFCSPHIGHO2_01_FULL_40_11]|uniref:DUF86 domain-containing protein n=1 Tax=Candidatus Daviesbacteria bacterium RIFCSPHIGHO2_01_FULL_40_11 TaxID=1797762 RepID=A0A1F5JKM9_9BACT|nr:MAG: hypothetical protein A2867_02770 [Candidatus Daviesbacteria bacterium RIFCSPHIGHO2_01_FULL_40_11]OGE62958.1 MAG: hypothetical protein A2964_01595 [Candidatus Daviesbacteria bacterium RIFCSPLOWO2_01_FULL_40_27]